MNIFFYIILYASVLLGAAGQIMLKLGAGAGGLNLGLLRINTWVVLGLGAMVLSILLSVRGLSVVPLRDLVFILPTVYIAVPLLAHIFLKETLSYRTLIGTLIIIIGIVVFNIPMMQLI